MSDTTCISCRKPKATVECGLCESRLCKACAQFLAPTALSFRSSLEDDLKHLYYCGPCYDDRVAPELESYSEVLERAKLAFVFFETGKKSPPIIKKAKDRISVQSHDDRDETILHLAFLSAEKGYNAIMEVEVLSKKIRNEGFQTLVWTGDALPVMIDEDKMDVYERKGKRILGE